MATYKFQFTMNTIPDGDPDQPYSFPAGLQFQVEADSFDEAKAKLMAALINGSEVELSLFQ